MTSKKIIGIDLGTTNSCVAVMEGGKPVVIASAEGLRTTPSVVAFKGPDRLVGVTAKRQSITNAENTIYSSKRFIGRKYSEVGSETKIVPFKVTEGTGGSAVFEVGGKLLTPEEVASYVLIKMKETAEAYLGEKVTEAVITTPAYFNDAQRQSTKDAGRIAGLNVRRIIPEPTAAALAYGLDKQKTSHKIAVYDLGGGTFDISMLEIGDGVVEVISTNGDTHLGGDDFDSIILTWLIDTFMKEQAIDLHADKMALQRLRDAAEKAKIELSGTTSTEINQPFITMDASGPKHMAITLSRTMMENLVSHLVERTVGPCMKALKDAGWSKDDLAEVILVGGMTRMPCVQQKVRDIFGKEPNKSVNPDEAVAMGAAIQGGVLAGEVKDILLLDVTPLTLGIETLGGVMTPIIERNTTIPAQKKQVFSTAADNQPAVTVRILQGERPMAHDNKEIGRFDLTEIPPSPRGVPQIEVAFDIDADGILHVGAKDLSSGKEQKIRIQAKSGLDEGEIQRVIRDAEAHAAEDKKRKASADTKNEADAMVFRAEKALRDYKEQIPAEIATDVQQKVDVLKKAIEANDEAKVASAKQELEEHMQHIGEAMAKKAGVHAPGDTGATPPPGTGPQASSSSGQTKPKGSEGVEDAEVIVEDPRE